MTTSVFTFNLAGHVRHQGLPVSGVTVLLEDLSRGSHRGAQSEASQRTGARGEFSFAVRPGTYRLTFKPDPFTRYLQHVIPEIEVAANTTCNVGLRIGSMITIKPSTASGARLNQGEIFALGIEPSSYQCVATASQSGEYSLVLPRGKFHLAFCRSRVEPETTAGSQESGREKVKTNSKQPGKANKPDRSDKSDELNPNQSKAFIATSIKVLDVHGDGSHELVVADLVKLKGRVTDVFGHPVTQARVTMVPSAKNDDQLLLELGLKACAITDSQGRFQINAEPGLYDMTISPDQLNRHCELQESGLEITGDLDKEFRLPEGHRLRGQVNSDDSPLSGCRVRVVGMDRTIDTVVETDAEGRFSLGVPAGSYRLAASHERSAVYSQSGGREREEIELAPWTREVRVGGDTHVAARLQRGVPVEGTLQDSTEKPRKGVPVHVVADSGNDLDLRDLDPALATTVTDGRGRFHFALAPGRYWLVVHLDILNARAFEVETQAVELDVSWKDWCLMKFEVTDESGQKIPRCRIMYTPYGTGEIEVPGNGDDRADLPFIQSITETISRGQVITGEDGVGTILIPSGVYAIKFKPPPDGSYDAKTIRQLSVLGDLTKSVRLPFRPDAR